MYLTYKIRTRLWWGVSTRASSMADGAWPPQIKATPTTHTCKAHPGHSITLVTEDTPTTTAMATMFINNTARARHQPRPQATGQQLQQQPPPTSNHGMTPEA